MRGLAVVDENLTRRDFCRAATAALAAPCVVTSGALGGDGRPPASERVVTGYLGVGPRGLLNLREQLSCPQAQVVAVCDVWAGLRRRAKGVVDAHYQNGDCRAYHDFRDLLARDDVDDAVRSDVVSHVSDIAIRTGRKITWDPAKEEIVGDEGASRMLSRAMRDPWQL